jgi:hypothetical protein
MMVEEALEGDVQQRSVFVPTPPWWVEAENGREVREMCNATGQNPMKLAMLIVKAFQTQDY